MATKIDTSKLKLLPVPEGLKIKYKHFYVRDCRQLDAPARLVATQAWLTDNGTNVVWLDEAIVNPKDTPIKKLGKAIAHNRCIKGYLRNQNAAKHTDSPVSHPSTSSAPLSAGTAA